MKIRFLGAAGTVTGSRYLLSVGKLRILVDCGLFQGYKQLRLLNWDPLPVPPAQIDVVLLTHAHLDHSGYLPLLVRNGFRGKIVCTEASAELCRILLPDSGHLQEEDAAFANRHRFSKHDPALPLYTEEDAKICLRQLSPVDFGQAVDLAPGIQERKSQSDNRENWWPAGRTLRAVTGTIRKKPRARFEMECFGLEMSAIRITMVTSIFKIV